MSVRRGVDLPLAQLNEMTPLEAALIYHAHGYRVMPWIIVEGRKQKHPCLAGWNAPDFNPTENDIRGWWVQWPHAGVGLVTNPQAGIFALDVDHVDDRQRAEEQHGAWNPSLTQLSGRGGGAHHVIYLWPAGSEITQGKLGAQDFPGIDVKSNGFVAVSPSRHPAGGQYQWDTSYPAEIQAAGYHLRTMLAVRQEERWQRERPSSPSTGGTQSGHSDRPNIDALLRDGISHGGHDNVLRDVVWYGALDGKGDEELWLVWSAIVHRTVTDPAHPFTRSDFDRHLRSAREKLAEFEPVVTEPWMMELAHHWHLEGIIKLLGGAATFDEAQRFDKQLKHERQARLVRRTVDSEELGETFVEPELKILESFLDEADDPVTFRVARLFPAGGRVLLSAQYKAGKTTMRDNLVRSLVDGEPFLGEYACAPVQGRVVVLDLELAEGTMRRWLREQRFVNTDRVAVASLRGRGSSFNIMNDEIMSWWVDHLTKIRCGVLILDCLRPAMDALGLDENRDAGRFLTKFDELLDRANVPDGMIIHHMGHEGERSRGDSRLRDWPDAEWRMLRVDHDDPNSARTFSAIGRDVNVVQHGLNFDQDTRRLTLGMQTNAQAVREAGQVDELIPQIVAAVASDPGINSRGLRDLLPLRGHLVDRARAIAIERGLIYTVPGPRNSVTHFPGVAE